MKPHLHQCWCIPPKHNAEFVAGMEDVLDVYCLPYDPTWPVVCMDETTKQLVAETRTPVAAEPGRPARYDAEYERCGVANLFLFTEPLGGWRRVTVTGHRTRLDWAEQIRHLLDVEYPDAAGIRLVMDNLNTHSIASLYEAFAPAEARRLAKRLDIHYTPKHGSWWPSHTLGAEHRGDRVERIGPPMPGPPDRGHQDTAPGVFGLGRGTKRASKRRRLAVHNQRRANQTQTALPTD